MATEHIKLNTVVKQLATTNGTALYTVPSSKKGMVKTIVLHNTASVSKTAEIFFDGTTDSDRMLNVELGAGETFEYSVGHMLPLAVGDTINGREAATGSVVNCFIFGAQEDV